MNDASDPNEVWRLTGEFGDLGKAPVSQIQQPDVLPDMRQNGHLFVFAQTPEQIAAKLAQIAAEPPETQAHLVIIGASATVHTVATPADALSAVVQVLTKAP